MAAISQLAVATLACYARLASSVQLKSGAGQLPTVNQIVDAVQEFASDEIDASENYGCGRGHDCGLLAGETSEPMSVNCSDGEKWFARNAIFIRGQDGKNAIYCSVPKIGTTYMFGVLDDLHLATRGGKRNAGFEAVHEIISAKDPAGLQDLCNAYTFMLIRNPWERVASGYVDKVLTKEVFSKPPSFDAFLKMLARVEEPGQINQHFRPASLTCQTTGEHAMQYDQRIKMEGDPRHHLESIFIHKLKIPEDKVVQVLDKWDAQTHSTKEGGRWELIDKSIASDLDRVHYYFQFSDPKLVEETFGDDIAFGNYKYPHGK